MRAARRLKVVFFDAGQTLIEVRSSVGAVYAEAAGELGLEADPGELDLRFRAAWERSVARIAERGHRSSDELLRAEWRRIVSETFPDGVDPEKLERIFERVYERFSSAEAWRIVPGARETLEALGRLGLEAGVLSNWDGRLPGLLEELGLLERFDHVVVSYAVGFEKPHPAMFEEALRRSGARPEETLHVGDSWDMDVEPALRAGMGAVWLSRGEASRDPRVPALDRFPDRPDDFWADLAGARQKKARKKRRAG